MKKWFKSIFSFNSSEEKGRFALLFLFWVVFTCVLLKQYWYPYFYSEEDETELILTYVDTLVVSSSDTLNFDETNTQLSDLKRFDPNEVDSVFLTEINLKPYVIRNWLKFLNSGGRFNRSEDVKKIYGLSDEHYIQLKPFIRIETKTIKSEHKEKKQLPRNNYPALVSVDINTADSVLLTKVSGIGPVFASRIIKYREALGGFIGSAQLYEVFGMDSTVVDNNKDLWRIETSKINTININTCTFKELLKHPYINYPQVQAIFNYKKQHGDFTSKSELLNIVVLDSNWYNKIQVYLTVE